MKQTNPQKHTRHFWREMAIFLFWVIVTEEYGNISMHFLVNQSNRWIIGLLTLGWLVMGFAFGVLATYEAKQIRGK